MCDKYNKAIFKSTWKKEMFRAFSNGHGKELPTDHRLGRLSSIHWYLNWGKKKGRRRPCSRTNIRHISWSKDACWRLPQASILYFPFSRNSRARAKKSYELGLRGVVTIRLNLNWEPDILWPQWVRFSDQTPLYIRKKPKFHSNKPSTERSEW